MLGASGRVPPGTPQIRGWDFDDGNDLHAVLGSMAHSGFQAAALGQGIAEVQRMVGPPAAPAGPQTISLRCRRTPPPPPSPMTLCVRASQE